MNITVTRLSPQGAQPLRIGGKGWVIASLCFLFLVGFSTRSVSGAAFIYNAWWSNSTDNDGDFCVSSARLNWDPDVVGGFGTFSVYERIYYKLTGSSTWTLFFTTAPHFINGASSQDSLYIPVSGSGSCTLFDYRIEVYQSGSFFYDHAFMLYGHLEESALLDIPISAVIYNAWWTDPQDTDSDGCVSLARLNWDVDLLGTTGALFVYEKIYYKLTGTATWTPYATTTPHAVTGSSSSDAVSLIIPGSGHCEFFDYRIEVYLNGLTVYDHAKDSSNDPDLASHREEESDGPPPDTSPPLITIVGPTANPSYSTMVNVVNLSGTTSDNVGAVLVSWTNDKGDGGTASGTSAWSIDGITLQPGMNTITVTARDAAGNTASDVLSVTLDLTIPTLQISVPTTNSAHVTASGTLTLGGSASDNEGVTQVAWVNDRGGGGTAAGTGSWTAEGITLQSGTNVITVRVRDAAGNSVQQAITITFDPVRPSVFVTSPTANPTHSTTASPISIAGTASDNLAVTNVTWSNNRGGGGAANGTTSWLVDGINLQLGANVVTVTAYDSAGNIIVDTLTVTYTPFVPVSGIYNGLFHERDCVRHESSGSFKLTLSSQGSFSSSLQLGGKRYSASGQFGVGGFATNVIRMSPSNSLLVTWSVDFGGSEQIVGAVVNGNWTAELIGDRAQTYPLANPAPHQGNFTWRIAGQTGDANFPGGDGCGTAVVNGSDVMSLTGVLADGTTITQKIPLSKDGKGPLYASLYSGKGSVLSWVNVNTNAALDDFRGDFCWIRPVVTSKKLYTNGFIFSTSIDGSLYRKPVVPINRVIDVTNAVLELSGGNLPRGITNDVVLQADSKVINVGTNKASMTLNLAKGLFKGAVTEGGTRKAVSFKGVVIQKQNLGSGFFLGSNQCGRVVFKDADSD